MKVVAIIQARMGSTRLPGKVLRHLGGTTVLAHVVGRVQRARGIDEVVVATTGASADDAIARATEELGVTVFRGSEDDVLERYCLAARRAQADVVIRVTSDCPLIDSTVLQAMLDRFMASRQSKARADYLSNTLIRTFPRGLDVEIFTFAALERAAREAKLPTEREHVTPYIYGHPELFSLEHYRQDVDLSRHRWTLDTEADWQLLSALFTRLGASRATTEAVLSVLRQDPGLEQLNAQVVQKT